MPLRIHVPVHGDPGPQVAAPHTSNVSVTGSEVLAVARDGGPFRPSRPASAGERGLSDSMLLQIAEAQVRKAVRLHGTLPHA